MNTVPRTWRDAHDDAEERRFRLTASGNATTPQRETPKVRHYFLTGLEEETRVVDPITGGEKGRKLAQLGALSPQALYAVAEVAGAGALKYSRHNWMLGYDWSLSDDAMERHLMKYRAGEDVDPEDGLLHLAHAVWHGLALLHYQLTETGNDDRYKAPNTTKEN